MMIVADPYSVNGGAAKATWKPIAITVPGMTNGAIARNASNTASVAAASQYHSVRQTGTTALSWRRIRLGVVLECEVALGEGFSPGAGDGGLNRGQHWQEHRQQADEQAVGQQQEAAGAELDRAAFAAIAGLRDEAFAARISRRVATISRVTGSRGGVWRRCRTAPPPPERQ